MPSIQDHPPAFTPSRQSQSWTHDDRSSPYPLPEHRRPSMVPPEALRPMEPGSMQNPSRPYLPARLNDPIQPRQQLPGLHELLSPPLRNESSSSFSSNWSSVNTSQPNWSEGPASSSNAQLPPGGISSHMRPMPYNPTPPPFHRLSSDVPSIDRFAQPPLTASLSARPSFSAPPPPPLRKLSDFQGQRVSNQMPPPVQNGDAARPPQSQAAPSFHEDLPDRNLDRHLTSGQEMRNGLPASNYSLQCVGQRHIPGEGMCYVFKDGSTCPTIIDGEPVNPLWGTTKAGKARKRLAQACL